MAHAWEITVLAPLVVSSEQQSAYTMFANCAMVRKSSSMSPRKIMRWTLYTNQANTDAFQQQYHTSRGNHVPYERAEAQARQYQSPQISKYPKDYRNEEGKDNKNIHKNFADWEWRGQSGGDPKPKLFEYPLTTDGAGNVAFDYNMRATPAKTVNAPMNRGDRKDRVARPFNDPGPVRAIAGDNGYFAGTIYHPEGNTSGFVRAPLEPLDRETGQTMRQHRDMSTRPEIRRYEAAQREAKWDPNHPNANRRVMTVPGREQGSDVMTEAISNYKGGRKKKEKRNRQPTPVS